MPGALGFFKRSLAIVDSRASSGGGAMREQRLQRIEVAANIGLVHCNCGMQF